ncbi:unnamed protein product [Ceratitis capitata]|uniref:(Mediterranean fruit fly) hypothetical protein n=1 Tax=Ceratitis capitata TaxID=7213 RepID=A0A811UHS4_CERCA|nr:unnamed protein product [Ceratitis capitata]
MNEHFIKSEHAYQEYIYHRELQRIRKPNSINSNNMLLNTIAGTSSDLPNTSQQPLVLNTSTVNKEHLEDCLTISKEIEQREELQKAYRRHSHPTPLEATMIQQQIFECSVEDDSYLLALEYQNSNKPVQVTDLDAVSQTMDVCLKYFDEDVNVSSGGSCCVTPTTRLPVTGSVAAAVANYQGYMKYIGSPPPPYEECVSPKSRSEPEPHSNNIRELLKKYEQNIGKENSPKTQEKQPKLQERASKSQKPTKLVEEGVDPQKDAVEEQENSLKPQEAVKMEEQKKEADDAPNIRNKSLSPQDDILRRDEEPSRKSFNPQGEEKKTSKSLNKSPSNQQHQMKLQEEVSKVCKPQVVEEKTSKSQRLYPNLKEMMLEHSELHPKLQEASPKLTEKSPKQARNGKDVLRYAPPVILAAEPTKSPKLSRKSKVKQMAHMFNNRIHQLMGRNSNEKKTSNKADEKKSLKLKTDSKPTAAPKGKTRLPTFRTGLPSPVPSPRFRRKTTPATTTKATPSPFAQNENACLVAEDVFRKLSVKDKALLYNKFIEDMSKQHPQFSIHARVVEATVRNELERSGHEVTSPKVKDMARELEYKLQATKPKMSKWAVKHLAFLKKTPEYDVARTRVVSTLPGDNPADESPIKAKVDLAQYIDDEEYEEIDLDDVEDVEISTLTVVLKPTGVRREEPRPLPRKQREQKFINDMRMIELTQKRYNDSMRKSVSFDTSLPPKKIRRTRIERLQPKAIFQDRYMERMFYNWIMEKNGVTFNITSVENSEDSLSSNVTNEVNTSKSSTKSKSKMHALLHKAVAKLESVEARVMRRESHRLKRMEKDMKIIKEIREDHAADKSVIEVELMNSKTGTSSDELLDEQNRCPQRKIKRQAPQPPAAEAKVSLTEEAGQGVSQRKVKRQAPQPPAAETAAAVNNVIEATEQEVEKKVSQRKVKPQAPQPPAEFNKNEISAMEEIQDTKTQQKEILSKPSTATNPTEILIDDGVQEISQRKVQHQVPQPPTAMGQSEPATQEELHDSKAQSEEKKVLQKKVKRQAPQPPTATVNLNETSNPEEEMSSLSSLGKQSEAESESGLSSILKTSYESNTERITQSATKSVSFDLKEASTDTFLEKKNCAVEGRTVPTSTDSEESEDKARDDKGEEEKEVEKKDEEKNEEVQEIKEEEKGDNVACVNVPTTEPSSEPKFTLQQLYELAAAAREAIEKQQAPITPQKIKSAYTLTTLPTSLLQTESNLLPTPLPQADPNLQRRLSMYKQSSLSSPTLVLEQQRQMQKTPETPKQQKIQNREPENTMQQLIDSFVDLGFETGSNGMESPPVRRATGAPPEPLHRSTPLFVRLTSEMEQSPQQNLTNCSSTPINNMYHNLPQPHEVFKSNAARQIFQQSISPVCAFNARRRRTSLTEEGRRSSLAMQVISEDHPLEQVERTQTPLTPNTGADVSHIGNSFNSNASSGNNIERTVQEPTSKFWVRVGDFTISLDIAYHEPQRIRALYNIFSQKSCEAYDLHFGIDDYKFFVDKPNGKTCITKSLPKSQGLSHYWFCSGDLAMPFKGKYLAPEKIERMFAFLKDNVKFKMQIQFGVDDIEFSRVPDKQQFISKFSMESSYSMLLGLQGATPVLDERNRCGWPNSGYGSANSNTSSVRAGDLDYSETGSDLDTSEIRNITGSPSGTSCYYDAASVLSADGGSIWPRVSSKISRDNYLKTKDDNEELDKLYENEQKQYAQSKKSHNNKPTQSMPEMLERLLVQKVQLVALEDRMRKYSNHSLIAKTRIAVAKEIPYHMRKIRAVINAIDDIGQEKGFKGYSLENLEGFMYFLMRQADVCYSRCNEQLHAVLDALITYQQINHQELVKANKMLGVETLN